MWRVLHRLLFVVVLLGCAVVGCSLLRPGSVAASAGVNQQLSFEGKIVNSNGTNLTDGTYNLEFKIYQDGNSSGSGSTLEWTEDYLVAGSSGVPSTGGVTVTNGTFQVNLGSICGGFAAGTCGAKTEAGVDFNQQTLWLSMQVGNTSACTVTSSTTSFNTACGGDGEMTPFIRLTATPYALNADKLDGIDGTAFGQLANNQTWTGTNTLQPTTNIAGLIVKQTSAGSPTADILDVQNSAGTSNIIQATAAGALNLSTIGTTQTLALSTAASTTASTGAITIQSGNASSGTNLSAGTITVDTGTHTGAGTAAINLGTTNAAALAIGNATSTTTVTLEGGTASNAIQIGNGATAHGIQIGTGAAAQTVVIGSTDTTSTTTINAGSGNIVIGAATLQRVASGTTTFDLKDASNTALSLTNSGAGGVSISLEAGGTYTGAGIVNIASGGATALNLDTGGAANINLGASNASTILIGSSSTSNTTQHLLQLNSFNTLADTSTCTTSTNQGALYYNVKSNNVRACINGGWQDLVSTAGLSQLLFGVVPNSGNTPGDLIGVSGNANSPCKVYWASATTYSVAPCLAYSGGREVNVAAVTGASITGITTTNIWENICLNSSGVPTLMGGATTTDGTQTAGNLTTGSSIGAPLLCLATFKGNGTANTLAAIYDIRTFTTTTKTYQTINSGTQILGGLVQQSTTAGLVSAPSSATATNLIGVIVASTGSASSSSPNILVAIAGPQWVKATGTSALPASATASTAIISTTTAGYSGTGTALTTANANLGSSQLTISTSCTTNTTFALTSCQFSQFTDININ